MYEKEKLKEELIRNDEKIKHIEKSKKEPFVYLAYTFIFWGIVDAFMPNNKSANITLVVLLVISCVVVLYFADKIDREKNMEIARLKKVNEEITEELKKYNE